MSLPYSLTSSLTSLLIYFLPFFIPYLLETAGCAGVRHGVQQEGGHARGAEELLDAPLDEPSEELIVTAVGVRDEDERVRRRERDDCREEFAPPIYGKHVRNVAGTAQAAD